MSVGLKDDIAPLNVWYSLNDRFTLKFVLYVTLTEITILPFFVLYGKIVAPIFLPFFNGYFSPFKYQLTCTQITHIHTKKFHTYSFHHLSTILTYTFLHQSIHNPYTLKILHQSIHKQLWLHQAHKFASILAQFSQLWHTHNGGYIKLINQHQWSVYKIQK